MIVDVYFAEVAITYLLLYFFYWLNLPTSKIQLGIHQQVFGWIAMFLLLLIGYQFFTLWQSGYLYEQLAFFNRVLGPYYFIPIIIEPFLLLLAVLNIFSRNRQKNWFQYSLLSLLILYLIGKLTIGQLGIAGITPGWHTTIYKTNVLGTISLFILIMGTLTFVIRKYGNNGAFNY